jgi:hypothetical protein
MNTVRCHSSVMRFGILVTCHFSQMGEGRKMGRCNFHGTEQVLPYGIRNHKVKSTFYGELHKPANSLRAKTSFSFFLSYQAASTWIQLIPPPSTWVSKVEKSNVSIEGNIRNIMRTIRPLSLRLSILHRRFINFVTPTRKFGKRPLLHCRPILFIMTVPRATS